MPSLMSSWLPWILLAAIPVLAVALRLFAGEDEPDNAIIHESGDDPGEGPRQDEPDGLLAAA